MRYYFLTNLKFVTLFLLSLAGCSEPAQSLKQDQATAMQDNTIELVHPTADADTPVQHCIIWLHGLGATANDFPPIVPHLDLNPQRPIRFIFPQAPDRPITVNAGYVMPGWYDIKGMDIASKEDREGLDESRLTVEKIISAQVEDGIPSSNIILAGFSQGGAVTYYAGTRSKHKLAGLLALSTYLVFSDQTADEQSEANLRTPIFASHGTQDPVVAVDLGLQSVNTLKELGYNIDWQTYPMQHEVSMPQIKAIGNWINSVFDSE